LPKRQISVYFYVDMQNLVKIGRSAAELFAYFLNFKMPSVRHLRFLYFRNICQKFKFSPISPSTCKIWWRSDDPRPMQYNIRLIDSKLTYRNR